MVENAVKGHNVMIVLQLSYTVRTWPISIIMIIYWAEIMLIYLQGVKFDLSKHEAYSNFTSWSDKF